jgi:hypothetical protein
MDKKIFHQNFAKAIEVVLPFSRQFVTNLLPSDCLSLLYPNMSYDGNPLIGDEQTFPEDSFGLTEEKPYIGPLTESDVVEFLWRNGRIPEWVNVTVSTFDEKYTYLELLCCGRFTATGGRLYHAGEGYPPFHVLGPDLPPDWESIEKSGKFDLHWHDTKPMI